MKDSTHNGLHALLQVCLAALVMYLSFKLKQAGLAVSSLTALASISAFMFGRSEAGKTLCALLFQGGGNGKKAERKAESPAHKPAAEVSALLYRSSQAAAVGAAIGLASANSILSRDGSSMHLAAGLLLSLSYGMAAALGTTIWAGAGIAAALASPLFGPGIEEIFTDTAVAATSVSLLFQVVGQGRRSQVSMEGNAALSSVALLASAYALSTLSSASPGTSSLALFRYLSYLALPLVLLVSERPAPAWLLAGPAISGILLCLSGVHIAFERCINLGVQVGLYHRLWIGGMHPAHTGHWLAAAFSVAFLGALSKPARIRYPSLAAAVLFGSVCILSYSRTAWLGMALGSALAVFFHLRQRERGKERDQIRKLKRWVPPVAMLALLSVLILQGPAFVYLSRIFHPRAMAHSGRLADFKISLRMLEESPLLGNGPNARRILSYKFISESDSVPSSYFREAGHNAFLKVATEAGVPAALAFLLLVILVIKAPIRAGCGNHPSKCWAAVSTAALTVPFMFGGLLDGPYSMFALAVGAALHSSAPGSSPPDRLPQLSARCKASLTAAGIILFIVASWPCTIAAVLRQAMRASIHHDHERAVGLASAACRMAPWLAEPFTTLGRIARKAGRTNESLQAFEKAYQLSGKTPVAAIRLAEAYVHAEKYKDARRLLGRYTPSSLGKRGLLLEVRAAIESGDQAGAAVFDYICSGGTVTSVIESAGAQRLAEARAALANAAVKLEKIMELEPGDHGRQRFQQAGLALADYHLFTGNPEAAERDYRLLLDEQPVPVEAARRLAGLLAALGRRVQAIQLLQGLARNSKPPERTVLLLEEARHIMAASESDADEKAARALKEASRSWRDVYLDPYPCYALAGKCRGLTEEERHEFLRMAEYTSVSWPLQVQRALKDSPSRPFTSYAAHAWSSNLALFSARHR